MQNESKLIDLVTLTELTREILSSRLSDFMRNSTIHFRMFLYLVTCFVSHKLEQFRLNATFQLTVTLIFYFILNLLLSA